LLAVGSAGIGLFAGNWFWTLYVDSIPEALQARSSLAGARLLFLLHGLGLGGVIGAWSILAVATARFFRPRSPVAEPPGGRDRV
jgi:hypothetical protein